MSNAKKLAAATTLALATGLFAVGCASNDSDGSSAASEHPRNGGTNADHPNRNSGANSGSNNGSDHPTEHPGL